MLEPKCIQFLEMLRILENHDISKRNAEDAIIALMNAYESSMTSPQKQAMHTEFVDYVKKLEEKRKEKMRKIDEEMMADFTSHAVYSEPGSDS